MSRQVCGEGMDAVEGAEAMEGCGGHRVGMEAVEGVWRLQQVECRLEMSQWWWGGLGGSQT